MDANALPTKTPPPIKRQKCCRAIGVVDWISFIVKLRSSSHGGYLKRVHEAIGVSRVIPLNIGTGGAATIFKVELQHPERYQVIHDLLSNLERSHGLSEPPSLDGMEVSLDLWPRDANAHEGAALTKRLMMSIKPPVIENPRMADNMGSELLPVGDSVDPRKTLYIGNKSSDLLWRVYWKRTDETFLGEEGKRMPKPLPESEWRARAEVRIQGDALANLNLATPMDLERFLFEKLITRGYFKFCQHAPGVAVLKENRWVEPAAQSLGVDEKSPACVLGLFACYDSRARPRSKSRYLITDTELTEAARSSLRSLTRRF